jgi:hypothetical protein
MYWKFYSYFFHFNFFSNMYYIHIILPTSTQRKSLRRLAVTEAVLTSQRQILVVASVDGVLPGLVVSELESEESVLAPRDIRVHVNLVEIFRKMSESLPAHRPQVHLRPGGEMYVPKLSIPGDLGGASQLVRRRAQEVAPDDVPERPSAATVLGHADLEFATGFFFFALARHVSERVDRQVFIQVRAQVDQAWNGQTSSGVIFVVCKTYCRLNWSSPVLASRSVSS